MEQNLDKRSKRSKRSVKIIDGSEKCKRQLVFEFQSSRVYEKRSKSRFLI